MLLPTNTGGDGTLAILPFFQEEIDTEILGADGDEELQGEELPS